MHVARIRLLSQTKLPHNRRTHLPLRKLWAAMQVRIRQRNSKYEKQLPPQNGPAQIAQDTNPISTMAEHILETLREGPKLKRTKTSMKDGGKW